MPNKSTESRRSSPLGQVSIVLAILNAAALFWIPIISAINLVFQPSILGGNQWFLFAKHTYWSSPLVLLVGLLAGLIGLFIKKWDRRYAVAGFVLNILVLLMFSGLLWGTWNLAMLGWDFVLGIGIR